MAVKLKVIGETRRIETSLAIQTLNDKLLDQSEKITEALYSIKDELLKEITQTRENSDARFKKLELWRSLVIGGAIVVGLFASSFVQSIIHRAIDPSQTTVHFTAPDPTLIK